MDLFLFFSNPGAGSAYSPEFKGVLLALISAFLWAVSASVYKKGLETTDPWSGNLMRTGLTVLGFFLIIFMKGSTSSLSAITYSLFFWLFVSAFFAFFLGDVLFLTSLKRIGVSRTVPVSSTYPLFVTIWAFLIFKRPMSILIILGTLFIVFAIKLISESESGINHTRADTRGILFALSAAVCWSLSVVMLDYLVLFLPSEVVGGVRFLITFLLTSVVVSTKTFTINKNSLFWIGLGGTIVLVIGNYIFLEAIRMAGSAKAAPISAVYPVISVFFAAVFLREKLTMKTVIGTFLSFFGVFLVIIG